MATFTISASADDANEVISTTVVSITLTGNSQAETNLDGLNHCGYRFQNVTIDPGARIRNAILKLNRLNNYSSLGLLNQVSFYCEAADNSSAFAATNGNISGRSRTTAYIPPNTFRDNTAQWELKGANIREPVQEVINRAGWVNGNALSVLVIGTGASGNYVRPYMWDYQSGASPYIITLEITLAPSFSSSNINPYPFQPGMAR